MPAPEYTALSWHLPVVCGEQRTGKEHMPLSPANVSREQRLYL